MVLNYYFYVIFLSLCSYLGSHRMVWQLVHDVLYVWGLEMIIRYVVLLITE